MRERTWLKGVRVQGSGVRVQLSGVKNPSATSRADPKTLSLIPKTCLLCLGSSLGSAQHHSLSARLFDLFGGGFGELVGVDGNGRSQLA